MAINRRMYRMAILSTTGTARKRTIPAVQEGGLCEIVSIHGRDEQKIAALAKEKSIPNFYVDAEELLDKSRPAFVFVGSPPSLHHEQIRMCAERGIPVICEKPLCTSAAEAKRIQALVTVHRIPFRLAHHLRHQPGIARLREIISKGKFGNLRRVAMQWGYWLNETAANAAWKLTPGTGGPDAFYDAGVHAVDLMLHLLPSPLQVTAIGHSSRLQKVVDNVSALVLCGGVTVELSASQSIRYPINSLTLDFEGGTIQAPHALSEKAFSQMEVVASDGATMEEFASTNLYGEEIRDFIALLDGGTSQGTTIDEAYFAVEVLEAITVSYKTGKTVALR
jgi:predicted dehydrogenase